MTKRREPFTREEALLRIAAKIGFANMGHAIGVSERTIRDYSDPDHASELTQLEQAHHLDLAYVLAGGDGYPLLESARARLDGAAAEAHKTFRSGLLGRTITAAKEVGDAIPALIAASAPGADPETRARARLEVKEAIGALCETLPSLTDDDGSKADGEREPGGSK